MVKSPNEGKILEWDDKPQTSKQTNKIPLFLELKKWFLKKMIFHGVWRLEGKEEYYQVFKSIYPFIFPFHRLYELYIYIYATI